MGLRINREKTKVVNLDQAGSLDFLGFTFRYDRDLYGSDKTYLNVTPSKKSLQKARDAIREKTGSGKCHQPAPKVVEDLNTFLRGWSNYSRVWLPAQSIPGLGSLHAFAVGEALESAQPERLPLPARDELPTISKRTWTSEPMMNACRKAGCGKSARPV